MNPYLPVLIISVILLIITILLSIADQLLVSYGECKITVREDEGTREFIVEGGDQLHRTLISNGVNITTSCGGKASCGYCKVQLLSGGGPLLPTEEVFMDRQEKLSGVRLACQVKVKDDIEVFIPDFLTTVRGIVKNKSYDPKLRWRFLKDGHEEDVIEKAVTKLPNDDMSYVSTVIEEHKDIPGAIVPILQRINGQFSYLPEPALRMTAKSMDMPLSEVYRVATFYNAFSLIPKGRNIIKVCMGTSCYVKGGGEILETMERKIGIKVGQSTEDLNFCLETVSCIGCCGQSPVIAVNDEIHGYFETKMIDDVLHAFS